MYNLGDIVYVCNENRRVYRDTPDGRRADRREYFTPETVVNENRASWITDKGTKFDKQTGEIRGGYVPGRHSTVYTAAQMDDWLWKEENFSRLNNAFQRCDTAKLRQIAAILDQA